MTDKWKDVVGNATRKYTAYTVTVTDLFGGRGHDYEVMDESIDKNGGMLVIATSIPDSREWNQWTGRTARQDHMGQYYVVLYQASEQLKQLKQLDLFLKMNKDDKIKCLLKWRDSNTNEQLKNYESDQAKGAWLNELCQKYYEENRRTKVLLTT